MFVLTLTLADPEDAGYFTNKTLNKLHGYMRHHDVKFALFFTKKHIKIYASEKLSLETLLKNEAVCFDVKRHIFEANLTPVTDSHILVYTRKRNTIHSVKKKVNQKMRRYENKFHLIDEALKDKQQKMLQYYKEQQQAQKHRHYFVVKNKNKRFTIWVEVRQLKVNTFVNTTFSSYGLIRLVKKKEI